MEMPATATRASNRAVGIHKPLRVPSPIVRPALLSSGMSDLLSPFEMYVGGENYDTASWNVKLMAGQVLEAARIDGNLAPTTALVARPRLQIMYDA
eukprot:1533978-Pleurochrysis_carterae.AAC.1